MPAIVSSNQLSKSPVAKKQLNDMYKDWLYVDRHDHRRELPESPLANPFFVDWKRPEGAVDRYRRWLWGKIQRKDKLVLDALRSISASTVLVCQYTLQRHSDNYASVIFKAAQYVQNNQI